MAFCPVCGWAQDPGVSFCPKCGTPHAASGAAAPAVAAPVAPQPVKLDLGDLLGHAFRRPLAHLGVYFRTVGVVLVASALLSMGANLWLSATVPDIEAMTDVEDMGAMFGALALYIGQAAAIGIAAAFLGIVASGLGVVVSDQLDRGLAPTLGEAWAELAPRFGNFLGTYLLIVLAVVGSVLAGLTLFILIVPIFLGIALAIYLALQWMLAPTHSVLARERITENLGTSARLTKGNRLVLLGTFLLLTLVAAIPSGILGAVVEAGAGFAGRETLALSPVVIVLQSVLTLPFTLFVGFAMPAALVRAYRQLTAPSAAPPAPPADPQPPAPYAPPPPPY